MDGSLVPSLFIAALGEKEAAGYETRWMGLDFDRCIISENTFTNFTVCAYKRTFSQQMFGGMVDNRRHR